MVARITENTAPTKEYKIEFNIELPNLGCLKTKLTSLPLAWKTMTIKGNTKNKKRIANNPICKYVDGLIFLKKFFILSGAI